MDYLRWAAENPFLAIFLVGVASYGLGQIGTHRTTVKIKLNKADIEDET